MLNNIDTWVLDILYPSKKFTMELMYLQEEKKWFIKNLLDKNIFENKHIFDASNINTKNIDNLWYHWDPKDTIFWESKWRQSRTDMKEGEFYELSIKLYNKFVKYLKRPNKTTIKTFIVSL